MTLKIKNPIFILNGPKRVGKDTVARCMQGFDQHIKTFASFKSPIFDIFKMTCPPAMAESFEELYETEGWKDTPNPGLNGKTPRELMIHISENFIKPFFGDNYYGKALADYITSFEAYGLMEENIWVIPDGGFESEINTLYEHFGHRIVVVHIRRNGFEEFVGDSRSFVNHPHVHTISERSDDSSEALALRLMGYVDYE